MRMNRLRVSGFLAALLFVGMTGCGKEAVNSLPPQATAVAPAPGATAVPVNQVISASFNQAMNAATITPSTFTLSSPSGMVAGLVTYSASGSLASFMPSANLAYNTLYTATITSGVKNTLGISPSGSYVWTFTTAIQPTVLSVVPAPGSTNVPLNQVLSATFSKAMNCATLASPASAFRLAGPGATTIAGTVSCSGSTATFTPSNPLAVNTSFTATITTAATDVAGDPLAANYVWSFKTAPSAGPLTVVATNPANGAFSVPINQVVTAAFSQSMNAATVTTSTFTLAAGATPVAGVVTYVSPGSIATFTPSAALAFNTVYTATITTGAMDTAGDMLARNYVWSFTTAAAANTTAPTVIATIPSNMATGVPLNQILSATFSKAMSAAAINGATFTLAGPGTTAVSAQVAYSSVGDTATLTPSSNLAPSTLYTATITTGAKDLAGNALAANYVWTFTTGTTLDTVAPEIVSTIPANGATNVPTNQSISATFSKAMNPLTISTSTFQLTGPGATSVTGTVSYDPINFIATFMPSAALNGSYVATITNGVTDLAGNSLGATGSANPWTFSTGTTGTVSAINLGTAALFGDFGGTAGMTNSGSLTVINGNIGTTGVSTKVVDLHDAAGCSYSETPVYTGGLVNGTIYTAPPAPTLNCTPPEGTAVTGAAAAQAALDALNAYNALVAVPNGLAVESCPGCGGGSPGELGNRTLAPGVYKATPGFYGIAAGPLTLDAHGDPNATWIFQMATTLDVGTPTAHESVILVNGAQAKNVFWQVGSFATINGILGGGTMQGTIIAQQGISVSTVGVAAITTINGRVLSLGPSVTIVNTVINVPAK